MDGQNAMMDLMNFQVLATAVNRHNLPVLMIRSVFLDLTCVMDLQLSGVMDFQIAPMDLMNWRRIVATALHQSLHVLMEGSAYQTTGNVTDTLAVRMVQMKNQVFVAQYKS